MREFNAFSWVLTCMFTFGKVMGTEVSFRGTYTLEVNRNYEVNVSQGQLGRLSVRPRQWAVVKEKGWSRGPCCLLSCHM